ncbi:membrane hypothetical protein [Candidatus Zixiibacteriota bacterium]|nr:membrane hypothetical protein [candidate division Zixibacteria bacterium]
MSRKLRNIILFLLGLHLAVLIVYALFRIIGGDEGVYLAATRAVGLHKALYSDFFFTQMPLLPTVFSSLALWGWKSLWILRGLAVTAGILSAIILFAIVLKLTRNITVSIVALAMYTLSGLIISMHTIYESPVFAHFLCLTTFYFWIRFREREKIRDLIFMGLFLGTLINLRATYIVLLPLYAWSLLTLSQKNRIKRAVWFILALAVPTLPTLRIIASSPTHFWFDNFIFQLYRETDRSAAYFILNKAAIFLRTVSDPHLLIIIALTLISIFLMVRSGRIGTFANIVRMPEGMAVANLILLALVYLVPYPTLRHYFEQYMAFAIIVIALNLENIWRRTADMWGILWRKIGLIILSAAYLLSMILYLAIDIFAVRDRDQRRYLPEVKRVTAKMLELAGPADTVFSEWPLYPFLTGQPVLPYTEIITSQWAMPLDHQGFMYYKLCDSTYLREAIERRTPRLVVAVYETPSYYKQQLNAGYDKLYQANEVSLYRSK